MEVKLKKTSPLYSPECIDTIFYSFGNYIFPIMTSKKDKSEFVSQWETNT
jgi:hypothetical protein